MAVFVTVPVELAWTTMLTNCELPTLREPRLQVMVVVPAHEPMLGLAETNDTVAGRVSETTTFVAVAGPLFVAVRR